MYRTIGPIYDDYESNRFNSLHQYPYHYQIPFTGFICVIMRLCFVVRTCLTCRLHHVGVISNYATRTRGRKRPEGSCLLAGNDSFEAVTVTRFARQLSSLSLQNILPSRRFRLFLPRRLRLHRYPFRLIRNTLRSATIPLIIRMLRPPRRFEQGKQTEENFRLRPIKDFDITVARSARI